MIAGKPIIYAIHADIDPVSDAGCGISIPPENPEALVWAVRQLISTSKLELDAMGARGHKYCALHHDYRNLAKNFLSNF
jgi:hypothetical protein